MATLVANGIPIGDAAVQVGLTKKSAYQIGRRPAFQALVSTIEARNAEKMAQDGAAMVIEDFGHNVTFLKDVRDGKIPDDPKVLRERLKAGITLFDRQMPRKIEQKSENTLVVRLDGRMLAGMAKIIAEDDKGGGPPAIDAEFTAVKELEDQSDG